MEEEIYSDEPKYLLPNDREDEAKEIQELRRLISDDRKSLILHEEQLMDAIAKEYHINDKDFVGKYIKLGADKLTNSMTYGLVNKVIRQCNGLKIFFDNSFTIYDNKGGHYYLVINEYSDDDFDSAELIPYSSVGNIKELTKDEYKNTLLQYVEKFTELVR